MRRPSDRATDGVSYNNTLQHFTGHVVRFDRDRANPAVIFTSRDSGTGGITYDPSDGTLWSAVHGPDNLLYHFSRTGDDLGSVHVDGMGGYLVSAEFAIPAPSAMAPLALAAVFRRARR